MMALGIIMYCILLWVSGRRIPGRPRRRMGELNTGYERRKIGLVLGYYFILALLILSGFLLINYMIKGT